MSRSVVTRRLQIRSSTALKGYNCNLLRPVHGMLRQAPRPAFHRERLVDHALGAGQFPPRSPSNLFGPGGGLIPLSRSRPDGVRPKAAPMRCMSAIASRSSGGNAAFSRKARFDGSIEAVGRTALTASYDCSAIPER